ncbi:MAG: 2-isopropylmalate synthase [Acidobacteriota bacterium]
MQTARLIEKYRPFPAVALTNRTWPDKTITQAPAWLSTDLRDGNQALFDPLDTASKLKLFKLLVDIGFKEIEVAFPSASQTDFDFVRTLIEGGHIPRDVTISVLTQAREHLIRRTVESLEGARSAIVHIYVSTAPVFREVVFQKSPEEVRRMAVEAVLLTRQLTAAQPDTAWTLEFTPENFTGTELEFARDVCDDVTAAWGATPEDKVIVNLPATLELATPNVYADQIEWMHRNLARRDSVVISVHPHNDRGCAVAAAELAQLAGAERVEGCLFGNGERTGNADLVTLALNLHTQGIAPGLDFRRMAEVTAAMEELTRLPVHPRHPYAGELVFTAFSGSHQDAIKKGFAARTPDSLWNVPYLPIDPADLGRGYEAIVRVNGQSGKGGVAYVMEATYGLVMPRRLQVEFAAAVQHHADTHGGEIPPETLWKLFAREYLEKAKPILYAGHQLVDVPGRQGIRLEVGVGRRTVSAMGEGNGPLDAAVHALGLPLRIHSYEERALGVGADARAASFVEVSLDGVTGSTFGVGLSPNIVTSAILAVLCGANRLLARLPKDKRQDVLDMLVGE